MRKETIQNKLLDLLAEATGKDVSHLKVETDKRGKAIDPAKSKKKQDQFIGVSDAELANHREAQALTYFLQAPELFSAKVCPHCGETFLVSRQYVAFCSYTCIAKDLETKGIQWSRLDRGNGTLQIDKTYIDRIYEGNEPLWIKNIDFIRELLDTAQQSLLVKTVTEPV